MNEEEECDAIQSMCIASHSYITISKQCLFPLFLSGDVCDLILVFFDPMGQALCKRSLNIVEKLNDKHGDRLHFYLSKADEAGGESDRQVCT